MHESHHLVLVLYLVIRFIRIRIVRFKLVGNRPVDESSDRCAFKSFMVFVFYAAKYNKDKTKNQKRRAKKKAKREQESTAKGNDRSKNVCENNV